MCLSQETIRGNIDEEGVNGILSTFPSLPETSMQMLLPCKKCYRTYGADASGEICRIKKLHLEPNFCDPQNSYNSETPLDVIHSIIEALRSTIEAYRWKEFSQDRHAFPFSVKTDVSSIAPILPSRSNAGRRKNTAAWKPPSTLPLGRVRHILQDKKGNLLLGLLSMDGNVFEWITSEGLLRRCLGQIPQNTFSVISVPLEMEASPWRHFPYAIELHIETTYGPGKGKHPSSPPLPQAKACKTMEDLGTFPHKKLKRDRCQVLPCVGPTAALATCLPSFSNASPLFALSSKPEGQPSNSRRKISAVSPLTAQTKAAGLSSQETGQAYVETFKQIREALQGPPSPPIATPWPSHRAAKTLPSSAIPYLSYLKYLCVETLSVLLPFFMASCQWHGVVAYMHLHYLMKASYTWEIHLYVHLFLSEIFCKATVDAPAVPAWIDMAGVTPRVHAYCHQASSRLTAVGDTLECIRRFMEAYEDGPGSGGGEEGGTEGGLKEEGKRIVLGNTKTAAASPISPSSETPSIASASPSPSLHGHGEGIEGSCLQCVKDFSSLLSTGKSFFPNSMDAEMNASHAWLSGPLPSPVGNLPTSPPTLPTAATVSLLPRKPFPSASGLQPPFLDAFSWLSTPREAPTGRLVVNVAAYQEPFMDVMTFIHYSKTAQVAYLQSLMRKHTLSTPAKGGMPFFPTSSPRSGTAHSNTSTSSLSGTSGERAKNDAKPPSLLMENVHGHFEDEEKRRCIQPGLKVAGKRVKRGEKYRYLWFSRAFLEYMGGIREETDDHAVFQYLCHYATQSGLTQEKNGRFLLDASLTAWLGDITYLPRSRRSMLEALQHQNHLQYEVLL